MWVLATAKQFSYLSACDKIIFTEGQVWKYVHKIGFSFFIASKNICKLPQPL
jgi:hypothetical protein